jgi:hypothetical protein
MPMRLVFFSVARFFQGESFCYNSLIVWVNSGRPASKTIIIKVDKQIETN